MTQDGTHDLFRRLFDSIVKPLLNGEEDDFGRLYRFVELNDDEAAKVLFQGTFGCRGGRELLETIFFSMARDEKDGLSLLATVIAGETTASFGDRFRSECRTGEKPTRVALLDVLPAFAIGGWARKVLTAGLLDREQEIREAASRALTALYGPDCEYDPEDPPAEREVMVHELFGVAKR
jgi:hypothetical protein